MLPALLILPELWYYLQGVIIIPSVPVFVERASSVKAAVLCRAWVIIAGA